MDCGWWITGRTTKTDRSGASMLFFKDTDEQGL
jgi:hypothetical protein